MSTPVGRTGPARRAVATVAGISAAAASMSGTLVAFAAPASATAAAGQDVLNDWGQTANEVDNEVAKLVDTDPRVVAAIARYSRAVQSYWSLKQVQQTVHSARRVALATKTKKDDRRTKRQVNAIDAKVLKAAREVVFSQLAMVKTVEAVEAAVRATHYVLAPHIAIPSTPTGLVAASASGQVALTWAMTDGATSYRIYRDGAQVGTTIVPAFTDTSVTNGSAYAYTVIAQNVAGWSASPTRRSAHRRPRPPRFPRTWQPPRATDRSRSRGPRRPLRRATGSTATGRSSRARPPRAISTSVWPTARRTPTPWSR